MHSHQSAAIILLFVLAGWTGKKAATVIAMSMIVLMPIGVIVKDAVARPRPLIPKSDFLIAADSAFAFPSGHAFIVSAGATVALLLFNNTTRKFVIPIALTVEVALVCINKSTFVSCMWYECYSKNCNGLKLEGGRCSRE